MVAPVILSFCGSTRTGLASMYAVVTVSVSFQISRRRALARAIPVPIAKRTACQTSCVRGRRERDLFHPVSFVGVAKLVFNAVPLLSWRRRVPLTRGVICGAFLEFFSADQTSCPGVHRKCAVFLPFFNTASRVAVETVRFDVNVQRTCVRDGCVDRSQTSPPLSSALVVRMCVCPTLYVEIRDLRKLERASGNGWFLAKARRKTGVIVRPPCAVW